ncbi:MAG: LytR C-terminal domain-containing protein [Candidatus Cloacimonetes bacterium]|nr:LytR C-terminal domain-containing protein [Candidatus Cloacimonadota bacterium]
MDESKKYLSPNSIVLFIILIVLSLALYFLLVNLNHDEEQNELLDLTEIGKLKVKVLNGCGYPGVAQTVTHILIERGIDVISLGNADKFIYKKTIIVRKRPDEAKLRYLMDLTGIKRHISAYSDIEFADFYLIVGNDYKTYFK